MKQKFKYILPYWLIFLTLSISVEFITFKIDVSIQNSHFNPIPKVLGSETEIRGQEPETDIVTSISQIKPINTDKITAKSFLIFNLKTGQVLAEKSPDLKLQIASLTKLITSLVTYENTDFNFEITITKYDQNPVKPNLNLIVGDKIKALDLFNSMIIGSSNDSAQTLANFVEDSTKKKFTDLMNEMAKKLDMANSNFSNPIGFDNLYNYSTANDLKKLITATQSKAVYTNLGRRTSYEFTSILGNKYSIKATNKLISTHPEIEAIKTGFTFGSQGSLATKITINNQPIIFLILGSGDREKDTLNLEEQIKTNYQFN